MVSGLPGLPARQRAAPRGFVVLLSPHHPGTSSCQGRSHLVRGAAVLIAALLHEVIEAADVCATEGEGHSGGMKSGELHHSQEFSGKPFKRKQIDPTCTTRLRERPKEYESLKKNWKYLIVFDPLTFVLDQ